MTHRIFVDQSTGEKFEIEEYAVVSTGADTSNLPVYTLKPLPKPESKKNYILRFDLEGVYSTLVHEDYQFTPEQGERVAEALRVVMRYITVGLSSDEEHELETATESARTAILRGAE